MKFLIGWGFGKLFVDLLLIALAIYYFSHSMKDGTPVQYTVGSETTNIISALVDMGFTVSFLSGLAAKSTKLQSIRIFCIYSPVASILLLVDIRSLLMFLSYKIGFQLMDTECTVLILRLIMYSVILVFQTYVSVLTVRLYKKLNRVHKTETGCELSSLLSSALPRPAPLSSAPPSSAPEYPAPPPSTIQYSTPPSYSMQYPTPASSTSFHPALTPNFSAQLGGFVPHNEGGH